MEWDGKTANDNVDDILSRTFNQSRPRMLRAITGSLHRKGTQGYERGQSKENKHGPYGYGQTAGTDAHDRGN